MTRAIILDESQGAVLGEMVAGLLKDISQEQSSLRFPVSLATSSSVMPCVLCVCAETGSTCSYQTLGEDLPGVLYLER